MSRIVNICLGIGTALFLYGLIAILYMWIEDMQIHTSMSFYLYIVSMIAGFLLASIYYINEKDKRRITLVGTIPCIPIIILVQLPSVFVDNGQNTDTTLWISVIATAIAVISLIVAYKIGVYSRYATDESVFGRKHTTV